MVLTVNVRPLIANRWHLQLGDKTMNENTAKDDFKIIKLEVTTTAMEAQQIADELQKLITLRGDHVQCTGVRPLTEREWQEWERQQIHDQ